MTWNYFGQNFGRDFHRLHDLECLLNILVSVAVKDLQDHSALTSMPEKKAVTWVLAGPSCITWPAKLNEMVQ